MTVAASLKFFLNGIINPDVLLKEGFTKPRVRQEFAQKWWGSMVRYARSASQEEIQLESERAWEDAGN